MGARIAAAGLVLGVSTVAVPNPPGGVEGIPPRALQAYVQASAGAPCKLPWWDLAAVGAVESGHGTHGGAHIQDDGTMSVMAVSYADAYGPMQFILPTWKTYGQGDVNDIDDAAPATAAGRNRKPLERNWKTRLARPAPRDTRSPSGDSLRAPGSRRPAPSPSRVPHQAP